MKLARGGALTKLLDILSHVRGELGLRAPYLNPEQTCADGPEVTMSVMRIVFEFMELLAPAYILKSFRTTATIVLTPPAIATRDPELINELEITEKFEFVTPVHS